MVLAGIYLVAALIGGLLARAAKLPPLLGFLLAGFALAGLDIEKHPLIDILANLGVTLMLFAIGLQIDVKQLIKREVWLTAFTQSALMIGVGIGFLAMLTTIGLSAMEGSDISSWAMVSLALSFSSTVFVIKALEERGDTRSRYGQIAIGVLVMQDLIAVAFLAIISGATPSLWSLSLFLLVPARKLIIPLLERLGHGEMVVLLAVFLAIDPGYILFETVGLKGDLGAVAIGMLFASHPKSQELSNSIFSLKELLLVAFFLSIGLGGLPNLQEVLLGLLLLVLLFAQSIIYFLLIASAHMRRRTAVLTSLVMANNSEFALIIAATLIGAGLLDSSWLNIVSVAVASSFILGTFINMKANDWSNSLDTKWPQKNIEKLAPYERPVDLGDTNALVLGMGRVGQAAYIHLNEKERLVIGIEHDDSKAEQLEKEGFNIIHGDATDADLWLRVKKSPKLKKVILALPYYEANLDALKIIQNRGFTGKVVAISHWQSEADELKRLGADEVIILYTGAGAALAQAAFDE